MTVVSRQELLALGENLITPFNPKHVTPVGYDFTVGSIAQMRGLGRLRVEGKTLPLYDLIDPIPIVHRIAEGVAMFGDGFGWSLKPGLYFLTFQEYVNIPHDMLAYMHPRSTLLRMGATLETAVWDAGYQGISATILSIVNTWGVEIERGARIGHMTFHRLDEVSDAPYAGAYQGETGAT